MDGKATSMESSELDRPDLQALQAAVARSAIVVRPLGLEALLADWPRTRHSSDVDAVILAWLASCARHRRPVLS